MKVESAGRVVIDTNVWLSAFLIKDSVPAAVVRHVLEHGQPVLSSATFDELRTRLWRPKLDRYLGMEERNVLLHDLDALACWVKPDAATVAQSFSRNASDDGFVHAALAAGASLIVSGDQDLLCLDPLGTVRILAPHRALARWLGQGKP